MASKRTPESGPERERLHPRVVTFQSGDMLFAVLSVPLREAAAMDSLSPAEREVAVLAAAGLSNQAIAKCRGKAVRTIANQMASILSKLGVGSRYELAAYLALCPKADDR